MSGSSLLALGRRGLPLLLTVCGLGGCGGITTTDLGVVEGGSGGGAGAPGVGGLAGWVGSGGEALGGSGGTDPLACPPGLWLCGDECVDLGSDPANCGSCGFECGGSTVCNSGLCTTQCPSPLVNCYGSCIDPWSDSAYCGAGPDCYANPGVSCGPSEMCLEGICTFLIPCPPPLVDCFGMCIDPSYDPQFCGAGPDCYENPGTFCPPESECIEGTCVSMRCPPPLVDCFGMCIDPSYDQQFCGAGPDCYENPGWSCGPDQLCMDGMCESMIVCPPELVDCFGMCVDPLFDPQFCGAGPDCDENPGRVCGPEQMCFEGTCVSIICPPPLVDCYGLCIDPWSDQQFCGAGPDCYDSPGRPCGPDEICRNGICEPSFICPPELVDCFGMCIDPWIDPVYCGAGPDCEVNPGEDCLAIGLECIDGRCALLCPVGFTNCGSACVDTSTDVSNCGGCGVACRAGQICAAGSCITTSGDCTNIAPGATCTRSSGGSGEYGPALAIDGAGESSCEMSWVDSPTYASGAYWQLEWDEPIVVGSMFVDGNHATSPACGFPTGRDILYAEVQWWDGGMWITDGTLQDQENYAYTFSSPVVTSGIRLYDVYCTDIGNRGNAILYEWYVYSGRACPGPDDA